MKKREFTKMIVVAMAAATVFSAFPSVPAFAETVAAEDVQAEEAGENDEYTYLYAGLTWAEYWAAENVYDAGDDSSSDEVDTRGEHDKGAFDTVSRATANHGLHRGSFQCAAVIKADNGKEYNISYWKSVKNDDKTTVYAVLTDGSEIQFSRGTITEADGTTATMTEYDVTGLKYVPVKVKTADLDDFKAQYNVVENGGELAGGYSENKLSSYKGLVADVTADTNGLKTAEKNEDGSFSFSAREDGTESGIQGQALKVAPTAEDAGLTVHEADGSYGEFLRVDLTGDYGDLGANMQAVTWTYYGEDSSYTNAVATYGTKFAADNWMHKSMGIQLGLTDSLRCQLPEGYDGTGYWTITIAALGYEDVTYAFEAASDNIVTDDPVESTEALEAAIAKAEGLVESDYTADSWAAMQVELGEAKEELEAQHTQAAVDEATAHLTAAIDALVKKTPAAVTNLKAEAAGKNKVKLTWTKSADADGYIIYGKKASGKYGYVGMTSKTTYTDTKAADSEYNFYWVYPYRLDSAGKRAINTSCKYVYAKGVCTSVTNLKAANQKGSVKLTWTKSAGADGYLIYGKTASGKYGYIGMTSKTSYVDTKASKSEYNFYWVFPYHKDADGKRVVGQKSTNYVYGKAK